MRYPLNTVVLNGWLTLYGSGTADVAIQVEGAEQSHKTGSGTASVAIDASGSGVMGVGGSGALDVVIEAVGSSRTAVAGGSAPVEMMVEVILAIRRPPVRPQAMTATHHSRITVVAPQEFALRVASENRTSRVPPERRTTVVPRERGI